MFEWLGRLLVRPITDMIIWLIVPGLIMFIWILFRVRRRGQEENKALLTVRFITAFLAAAALILLGVGWITPDLPEHSVLPATATPSLTPKPAATLLPWLDAKLCATQTCTPTPTPTSTATFTPTYTPAPTAPLTSTLSPTPTPTYTASDLTSTVTPTPTPLCQGRGFYFITPQRGDRIKYGENVVIEAQIKDPKHYHHYEVFYATGKLLDGNESVWLGHRAIPAVPGTPAPATPSDGHILTTWMPPERGTFTLRLYGLYASEYQHDWQPIECVVWIEVE